MQLNRNIVTPKTQVLCYAYSWMTIGFGLIDCGFKSQPSHISFHLTSVPQKNLVYYYYCAWYVFLRYRCYFPKRMKKYNKNMKGRKDSILSKVKQQPSDFNKYVNVPYARHYIPLFIRNRSWIITIHKARIWRKKPLEKRFRTSKSG